MEFTSGRRSWLPPGWFMPAAGWIVLGCSTLGCGSPVSVSDSLAGSAPMLAKSQVVEAGIVLSGVSGYCCLQLEQMGLQPGDKIVAAKASCECIRPRLIKVATTDSQVAQALLLEYVDETTADSQLPPANLGVLIQVQLATGAAHDFTVNLLHSHEVEGAVE